MLYVESKIKANILEEKMETAKEYYESLSQSLGKDDINNIIESLKDTELAVCLASLNENIQLNEFIVKHVSSKGEVTKTKDLKTRQVQAYQTTGLSKAKRREIARKAAKSKKSNPIGQKRAIKKKKKAMQRRKAMGL